MKNIVLLFIVPIMFGALRAQSADYFAVIEGGRSDTHIKSDYLSGADYGSTNGFIIQAGGGLKFQSGIVLGIGLSTQQSDNLLGLLDSYEVSKTQAFIGYRIPITKRFRITPLLVASRWTLTVNESSAFNSDEPQETRFKGTQTYPQMNIEFPVSNLITVVGSYKNINYDFGDSQSYSAGVIFEF